MTTEQVLVEFLADFSQLDAAADTLLKTGKIDAELANKFKATTVELTKQTAAVKNVTAATTPLKKNLDDVSKSVKSVTNSFKEGFQLGVVDALEEAGVTAEEFSSALQNAGIEGGTAIKSLRQELKDLTQSIAQAKANGKDFGTEFDALVVRAGKLKDAMNDANQTIQAVGSDTRVFDGLISGAQGVAGAFAIGQGAVALFGTESEELQKTLLKVNAALAILQGLQSVGNVLQKESALNILIESRGRIVNNAQIALQSALESKSIVVRGLATVAQRLLNAAMSANPIGIVVLALSTLIVALNAYSIGVKEAARATADLDSALESAGKGFDAEVAGIKRHTERVVSSLRERGALTSEILETQLRSEQIIDQRRQDEIERLDKEVIKNRNSNIVDIKAANDKVIEMQQESADAQLDIQTRQNELSKQKLDELLRSQIATTEAALGAAREGSRKQLALQKQLIDQQSRLQINEGNKTAEEIAAIELKALQAKRERQTDFNKKQFEDQVAGLETQLSKLLSTQLTEVEKGGLEETRIRQKIIATQAKAELENLKLTEAERQKIREDSISKQVELERTRIKKISAEAISDQISRNNQELQLVKTNDEDRLLLQISNIDLAAAAEVAASNGSAAKIKEIYAKRDADILAVKKQFIQDAVDYEISLNASREGSVRRSLQRIVADEKKSFDARKDAILQLKDIEVTEINKRITALNQMYDDILISDKEYNIKYAKLVDDRTAAEEKSAQDIIDLNKLRVQKTIGIIIEIAQAVSSVLQTLNENITISENNKLAAQKQTLADALQAGTITEKEGISRQKRIDAEERKLKMQQAQRDKQIAIFNAIIATAAGVAKAIPVVPLMIFAAAIGAAQVALIASRPIPKFGKGKRNQYEGLAEVGETGAELVERNGRMFVAKDRTITWLAARDKVYNPEETQSMIGKSSHRVNHAVMNGIGTHNGHEFDYEKLAKTMLKVLGKPVTNNISLDRDGFNMSVQEGLNLIKYMDKRYHR